MLTGPACASAIVSTAPTSPIKMSLCMVILTAGRERRWPMAAVGGAASCLTSVHAFCKLLVQATCIKGRTGIYGDDGSKSSDLHRGACPDGNQGTSRLDAGRPQERACRPRSERGFLIDLPRCRKARGGRGAL